MSFLHEKLKAITAAIENAFDFAEPEKVREKAEADFRQAVADEVKALTERVETLEKAAEKPLATLQAASAAQPLNLGALAADPAPVASAAIALDVAAVSGGVALATDSQPASRPADSSLESAIVATAGAAQADAPAAAISEPVRGLQGE